MIQRSSIIWNWLSVSTFFLIWEILAKWTVIPIELARPSSVIIYLYEVLLSGQLIADMGATLWRIGIGLTGGISVGILLGLLTGRSQLLNRIIGPIINLVRSMPPVALLTLFVALLGSTDVMRITAILITSIFSVYINTHVGASSVPIEYVRNARLLNSSVWKRTIYIILPSSLPFVLTGIRLSIATGFIVAYVGETAGTSSGVGFQIVDAQNSFQYSKMIAYLLLLGGLAAGTDHFIKWSAMHLFPWLKT